MEVTILNAKSRIVIGRKTRQLRDHGQIPAIVYGVGTKPTSISIDRNAFIKTYKNAGESTILELRIDEKNSLSVLIQEYQIDPIFDEITHVDFRSIDMNKEIETTVDLDFMNESPAVKTLGGTLVRSRENVNIRCLPSKLLRTIEVDLSKLKTFEDVFRISDLIVPEGVFILEDQKLSLAVVMPPRSEEEMAQLDREVDVDVSTVEVAGKKEEETEEDKNGEKANNHETQFPKGKGT